MAFAFRLLTLYPDWFCRAVVSITVGYTSDITYPGGFVGTLLPFYYYLQPFWFSSVFVLRTYTIYHWFALLVHSVTYRY